jgi:hypothetical protein
LTQTPSLWRRLLGGWLLIAGHFGEVQTLVLLGLIYSLVVGPASLIARAVGSDLLAKRGLGEPGSAWCDADSRPSDLENLKQPF